MSLRSTVIVARPYILVISSHYYSIASFWRFCHKWFNSKQRCFLVQLPIRLLEFTKDQHNFQNIFNNITICANRVWGSEPHWPRCVLNHPKPTLSNPSCCVYNSQIGSAANNADHYLRNKVLDIQGSAATFDSISKEHACLLLKPLLTSTSLDALVVHGHKYSER